MNVTNNETHLFYELGSSRQVHKFIGITTHSTTKERVRRGWKKIMIVIVVNSSNYVTKL